VCERLPPLLRHREPGVRAKACSLLGNLSKHAATFAAFQQQMAQVLIPLASRASLLHVLSPS